MSYTQGYTWGGMTLAVYTRVDAQLTDKALPGE